MTGHADHITVYPAGTSALYHEGHPVILADDKPWGGQSRIDAHDKGPQRAWLAKFKDRGPFVLVDIGANVGLFSRQALIALPGVTHVFAYEPDLKSWGAAKANLDPWADKVTLLNYAVGEATGPKVLHREVTNSGNYSFLPSAMGEFEHDETVVHALDIRDEMHHWIERKLPVLYKSDTQGYDEILASLLPLAFWRNIVFAAVFEVWRITGKPEAKWFVDVLKCFPHHRLLNVWHGADRAPGQDMTVDGVMTWLAEPNDYVGEDLAVW